VKASRFGPFVLAAVLALGVAGPSVRAQSSDIKSVEPKDIKDIVAQYKGKVVLLNFFATWCVPCHTEFPDIIKLQKAYQDKGLQVVEVSMNDVTDKDELEKYLGETKPPFKVYIAANTEDKFYTDVDPRWDTALPMTMIFDRDGKNVAFYKEARNYDQFSKDVTPLLAAK
jgi:thiol-disulfide isomerase/thioredoxin